MIGERDGEEGVSLRRVGRVSRASSGEEEEKARSWLFADADPETDVRVVPFHADVGANVDTDVAAPGSVIDPESKANIGASFLLIVLFLDGAAASYGPE